MLVRSKRKAKFRQNDPVDARLGWFELVDRKEEFLDIIRVLNRYYAMNPSTDHPNDSFRFREKMLASPREEVKIYMKRFGEYEFLITVKINDGKKESVESWIHVDGIQQERDELDQESQKSNPVFTITCISDLFVSSCQLWEEELEVE
ncbi:MAG: hypothetical protein AAF518_14950 [Spirochaetota bacterium]